MWTIYMHGRPRIEVPALPRQQENATAVRIRSQNQNLPVIYFCPSD
jgi:hypothetical protein